MISVAEALKIVLENSWQAPIIEVVVQAANGKVLAENIYAERDFPPFDRVTMDGIAYQTLTTEEDKDQTSAWSMGLVEAIQFAGELPKTLINPTACIEVMTGAVLPIGTDTVIRYEDVEFREINGQKFALVKVLAKAQGQNVHYQGMDRKAGDLLISSGTLMSPAEVAVAASVGKPTVKVYQMPRIAVISTGDELVDVHEKPLPHQIRRSNSYMLQTALEVHGARVELFHLIDDKELIHQKITELLQLFDVLILNGGVSEGKADFVPVVLAELGVQKLFHKVAQRPGKPFWFGKSLEGKVVFALPGNPVSTFVCCYKFVLPFMGVWGRARGMEQKVAVLDTNLIFEPSLTYFVPVKTHFAIDGRLMASPLKGSGSGDFANLLDCDGFLELPAGPTGFKRGEAFPLIAFR